jgi:hypothetical protein
VSVRRLRTALVLRLKARLRPRAQFSGDLNHQDGRRRRSMVDAQTEATASSSGGPSVSETTSAIRLDAGQVSATVAAPLGAVIGRRKMQIDGVRWLFKAFHGSLVKGYHGGILGDGMGVGKTVQTIVLVHTLIAAGQASSVLVVTPKDVLAQCQWAGEFAKFLRVSLAARCDETARFFTPAP